MKKYALGLLATLAFALVSSAAPGGGGTTGDAAVAQAYIPILEKNLRENILPFWMQQGLDEKHGGYFMNFGPDGRAKGPANKYVVGQARTLWFFSRLLRQGLGGPEHRHAADLGFQFLRDHLWDPVHGGFWWVVDESGATCLRPEKHLYGQAFALYGLSEYYLATKNEEARALARRLFDVIERQAHDAANGGYNEFFNEDWTPIPAGKVPYMDRHVPREDRADFKDMDTHLHIMEGLTPFFEATRLPLARERLLELITIMSNTVVRKDLGACTGRYAADWTPRLDGDFARVSYGHDLENVWLLAHACRVAGLPNALRMDAYRSLFNYSIRYGYDAKEGGVFDSGPLNRPADQFDKLMWVQAETATSALTLYRLTGDARDLEIFRQTWDYIERRLVDWKTGEWHLVVTPEDGPGGDKADAYKGPYHNGRAVMECLTLLQEMAGNDPTEQKDATSTHP